MINSVEVNNLITERKKLHPDDPKINDIWEQLIKIFSKDEHVINSAMIFLHMKYPFLNLNLEILDLTGLIHQ